MKRIFSAPYIVGAVMTLGCIVVFVLVDRGWQNFSINHELDPVNILTLGVNVFIAFAIQYYFAARATEDRAEKDILLDNLRDVFEMLRSCRDEVMGAYGTGKRVTRETEKKIIKLYRNLANALDNLQTALDMSGCKALVKEFDQISRRFYDYKRAGTGALPRAYDADAIGYHDRTYRALNKELHALTFKINKHHV
jgi:hypothetical protein